MMASADNSRSARCPSHAEVGSGPDGTSTAAVDWEGGAALLRCSEMSQADKLAVAAGVPSTTLMETAGRAVAEAVRRHYPKQVVVVLCGPGNNGGDGFVAARYLAQAGWPVRLALWGDRATLQGDAAYHAKAWDAPCLPWDNDILQGAGIVIDAVFGAGLSRDLPPAVATVLSAARQQGMALVAVDVPSGLDGNTGLPCGAVVAADRTITFFRRKPGHVLQPGRALCGHLEVIDIGIPASVLSTIQPLVWRNVPALWLSRLPFPGSVGHKYDRGHVAVLGGLRMTGAARLAAAAAQRAGAGLVTVAAPVPVWPIYAGALTSIMAEPCETPESGGQADGWGQVLADARRNVALLGPGLGRDPSQVAQVLKSFDGRRAVVLDADALSVFTADPGLLFASIQGVCVLTPHEGEFGRLFGVMAGSKLERALAAARLSQSVVILKGSDTIIAAPDGRAVINDNAPPSLATGGTGDVLAGFVAGLLAQGMPAFDAAAAAVWMHGRAASEVGIGLVPEDLLAAMPKVWQHCEGLLSPSLS